MPTCEPLRSSQREASLTRGHNDGSVYFRRRERRWAAAVSMPGGRRAERLAPWHDNTKARAKELLGDLLEERDAELDLPARRLTLAVWLRSWLVEMAESPRIAPATLKGYRIISERHIIPALGAITLARLGPSAIQRWLDAMDADPRTIEHRYATLRRALNVAVRRRKLVRNPALAVELPEIPAREAPTYDAAQIGVLLAGSADDWYGPLWALLVGSGLRISEALGLAWDDVDLDAGSVTVAAQLARRNGAFVRVPKLKAGRSLTRVALPPFAVAALREHRVAMMAARTPAWTHFGHVFVTPSGAPPYAWHVTQALYAAETRLGLPKLSPHGLRHASATLLADAGVAEDVRMRRLGHTTSAMARHYVHEAEAADRVAADALETALRRTS